MIFVPHIDLNVTEHCNLSCRSCSHASPVMKPWAMPLDMIERDLLALKPFLRTRSIQILGGEPLLHPLIVGVLQLVKRLRIDQGTSVITNGRLLPRMTEEFWRELEYLQISVYPGLPEDVLQLAEEKRQEFRFGLGVTKFDAFYNQIKAEPDDGVKAFTDCRWKTDCQTVHRGHFYLCSQSCFFPKALMGLPAETDGLPLAGITEEKLAAFLTRTEPLKACGVCCAHTMQTEPWREVKRGDWRKESTA